MSTRCTVGTASIGSEPRTAAATTPVSASATAAPPSHTSAVHGWTSGTARHPRGDTARQRGRESEQPVAAEHHRTAEQPEDGEQHEVVDPPGRVDERPAGRPCRAAGDRRDEQHPADPRRQEGPAGPAGEVDPEHDAPDGVRRAVPRAQDRDARGPVSGDRADGHHRDARHAHDHGHQARRAAVAQRVVRPGQQQERAVREEARPERRERRGEQPGRIAPPPRRRTRRASPAARGRPSPPSPAARTAPSARAPTARSPGTAPGRRRPPRRPAPGGSPCGSAGRGSRTGPGRTPTRPGRRPRRRLRGRPPRPRRPGAAPRPVEHDAPPRVAQHGVHALVAARARRGRSRNPDRSQATSSDADEGHDAAGARERRAAARSPVVRSNPGGPSTDACEEREARHHHDGVAHGCGDRHREAPARMEDGDRDRAGGVEHHLGHEEPEEVGHELALVGCDRRRHPEGQEPGEQRCGQHTGECDHAETGQRHAEHPTGHLLGTALVPRVEQAHEGRHQHGGQRAGGQELEQHVREEVGRLEGVAEVGRRRARPRRRARAGTPPPGTRPRWRPCPQPHGRRASPASRLWARRRQQPRRARRHTEVTRPRPRRGPRGPAPARRAPPRCPGRPPW